MLRQGGACAARGGGGGYANCHYVCTCVLTTFTVQSWHSFGLAVWRKVWFNRAGICSAYSARLREGNCWVAKGLSSQKGKSTWL